MNRPFSRRSGKGASMRREVNGWFIFDKPVGMTSTHAVAVVKRAFNAKKAGHAGTLDPLASGILPIALGEATKTVPYVMDGQKSYIFTVAFGAQTDTDDSEGQIVHSSENRPSREQLEALLPLYTGSIQQVPPRYSAIKIQGERAYDLARDGEIVELQPRQVEIEGIDILSFEPDRAVLAANCGKGTYIRSLARDFGIGLGCFGHVSALRRTRVGSFGQDHAVTIELLEAAREVEPEAPNLLDRLEPVQSALSQLPAIEISREGAGRLMRGQSLLLRGHHPPAEGQMLQALCNGLLVAIGTVQEGEFLPHRVFQLERASSRQDLGTKPSEAEAF